MRALDWSMSLTAAARALRDRGQARALSFVARLAAPPPPPQLSQLDGPELARQRLGDAAAALLGKGSTPAEAFRLLRLELNRLEQGGLSRATKPEPLTDDRAPEPTPRASSLIAGWALAELRARSRDLASRVLRAA